MALNIDMNAVNVISAVFQAGVGVVAAYAAYMSWKNNQKLGNVNRRIDWLSDDLKKVTKGVRGRGGRKLKIDY